MWFFKDLHLVAWPLLMGALVVVFRRFPASCPRWIVRAEIWLLQACILGVLAYAATAFLRPGFNEWVERGVVAVARYWDHGGDIYPPPMILAKLGIYPYGPLLFQIVGLAADLLGGANAALKGFAASLAVAVYGWMFWVLRRRTIGAAQSALVVGLLAVAVGIMGFMVKADILLIGLAALASGVVALRPTQGFTGVALAGLAGLAAAIKIHGAFYILPAAIEFLAVRRGGRVRDVAIGCAIAMLAALAPFLAPRTSLSGYFYVLSTASRDGLLPGIFISNLAFIGTCVLAVHALTPSALRDTAYRRLMLSVLGAGLIVSVFAAKSEAGPHHLIPFLPYLCLPLARALSRREKFSERALMLALFLVSFQPITSSVRYVFLMVAHWNAADALI